MAIFYWGDPLADSAWLPESAEPGIITLSEESVSPLNGDIQTTSLPGSRWTWMMNMPNQTAAERRRVWALLASLNGREHRLALWDLSQPNPRGSIPLAGVTVYAAAAQFATSIQLQTGSPGCVVKAGDWLKLGPNITDQLVMCIADATANGAGIVTINFRHMLRLAVTAGAAVGVSYAKGLFVLADPKLSGGQLQGQNYTGPMSFQLLEAFR